MNVFQKFFILKLFVLLTILNTSFTTNVFAQDSNRNKVRSRISSGGWHIVWGVTINEPEYAKFAAACYSGTPYTYFSDLLDRNIDKFSRNVSSVSRQGLHDTIAKAFKDRGRHFEINKIGIKAGIATYHRWKYVSAHIPGGTERYKIYGPRNPFTGKRAWAWGYRPKMVLVKKRIPLPNHHQPYVGFRLYGVSGISESSSNWTGTIRIYNNSSSKVYYKLKRGGNWKSFSLKPGYYNEHKDSLIPAKFTIEFDFSFASGYQKKRYNLSPNKHFKFSKSKNKLDLYRK